MGNGSEVCPMYLVVNGCCNDTVLTLIQTGSESLDECEDACDAHENCTAFDHTSVSTTVAAGASIRLRRLAGISTTEVCQLWQGNITAGTVTLGCNVSDPLQVCYMRECVTTTLGNTTTTEAVPTVTFFQLNPESERPAYADRNGAREPNLVQVALTLMVSATTVLNKPRR